MTNVTQVEVGSVVVMLSYRRGDNRLVLSLESTRKSKSLAALCSNSTRKSLRFSINSARRVADNYGQPNGCERSG